MEEKAILINGIKTNYKIAGQGPAILILHGWGVSSDSWLKVQKILSEKEHKVLIPDFPGFGKSDNPPQAWGVGDYSEWLKNFLDKIIQIGEISEPVFLMGHSFGGRIAIRFTKKYPEKIKKLILCSSAGIRPKLTIKQKIFFFLAEIGNKILPQKPWRKIFYSILGQKDYYEAKGVVKETFKKIIEEDLLPEISQIKTQTLILWGKKDKMVPIKYAHIFQEKIQNSKLEIFRDVGHSPHLERPEKLSETIISFLANKSEFKANLS